MCECTCVFSVIHLAKQNSNVNVRGARHHATHLRRKKLQVIAFIWWQIFVVNDSTGLFYMLHSSALGKLKGSQLPSLQDG